LLEAHGIRNYVIDPASLQDDRRAQQAKTSIGPEFATTLVGETASLNWISHSSWIYVSDTRGVVRTLGSSNIGSAG
jgi:hypothetical protein